MVFSGSSFDDCIICNIILNLKQLASQFGFKPPRFFHVSQWLLTCCGLSVSAMQQLQLVQDTPIQKVPLARNIFRASLELSFTFQLILCSKIKTTYVFVDTSTLSGGMPMRHQSRRSAWDKAGGGAGLELMFVKIVAFGGPEICVSFAKGSCFSGMFGFHMVPMNFAHGGSTFVLL